MKQIGMYIANLVNYLGISLLCSFCINNCAIDSPQSCAGGPKKSVSAFVTITLSSPLRVDRGEREVLGPLETS
jgi:hypothetical protein